MKASQFGENIPSDPTLRPVIAFGIIIHEQTEAAMSVTAAEHIRYMGPAELTKAHEAATVLARVAGNAIAQRKRNSE